ncbi:hypothetical protein [Neobacillus jeddahensis]|uniref:hypothetical protein n=1 Tax=Neobacillus jeddahensis TaxID=1461580 RepID=UPI00058E8D91|nr:hypothetical protein [Neobacillus jeddahensis]
MGFALFFLLAWLLTGIFIIIPKRLSPVENTFIFLLLLVIIINVSWINVEEMKAIHVSRKPLDYTAFLLNRSIIMPMIVLILMNLFHQFIFIVSTVVMMMGMSLLTTSFHILTYTKWNFGYDVLYYLLLALVALFSLRGFKQVTKDVVNPT